MQTDAVSHARTRCFHGLVCEVSIARGRLHLRVTEELADHREGLAERQRTGSEGMA